MQFTEISHTDYRYWHNMLNKRVDLYVRCANILSLIVVCNVSTTLYQTIYNVHFAQLPLPYKNDIQTGSNNDKILSGFLPIIPTRT